MAVTSAMIWNYRIQLPIIFLTKSDRLDKTMKFAEGFFKGFYELVEGVPFASRSVFSNTAKWLTAVALFNDFTYWTKYLPKEGRFEFQKDLKEDTIKFFKTSAIHFSHFCTTINLAKDCDVSFLQDLDKRLGKICLYGAQVSFKLAKDLALILACALSIGDTFKNILFYQDKDKNWQVRDQWTLLKTGRIFDGFQEKALFGFINSVSKVYVIAGVALNAPYDPLFFIMGALVGVTTLIKYVEDEKRDDSKKMGEYLKSKPVFDKIPFATEKYLFKK